MKVHGSNEGAGTTVVVGAGIGGLSAAIHASRIPGRRVLVCEAASRVGGKMGRLRADGFQWDTGPSVVTMPDVLSDVFAAAGLEMEEHLELIGIDPATRYHWRDTTVLSLTRDWPRLAAQLEALHPGEAERWLRFMAHAARLYRLTATSFIHGAAPSMTTLLRQPFWDVMRIDAFRSMMRAIRSHVRTREARQVLARFATYVGADPYRAPATLNVIAHVELTGGVWYPRGGVYRIAEALADAARGMGVEISTDALVERVDGDSAVRAVSLADGTRIPCDSVIVNVDAMTACATFLRGLPAAERLRSKLAGQRPSLSGLVLLLGVEDRHPQLAHHNIFFSDDYRAEFDALEAGRLAEDPTIYVAISSRTDPDHAPEGHANWFVLVNVPPLASDAHGGIDWSADGDRYRNLILDRLEGHGVDVRGAIVSEHRLTPVDLAQQTGAWRGALYGASSSGRWAAFRRPSNRMSGTRGVYLAGGTVHPGGGVPMVALSGRQAARCLAEDVDGRWWGERRPGDLA